MLSAYLPSDYEQQVRLEIKRIDGTRLTTAVFEGRGERVYAKNILNNREYWSFGPLPYTVNLFIIIHSKHWGRWRESKMVCPLAVSNC